MWARSIFHPIVVAEPGGGRDRVMSSNEKEDFCLGRGKGN